MTISDYLLCLAALLLLLTALTHSVLGEQLLIRPLLSRHDGVLASPVARMVIRFAWHLTSVTWLILAVILVRLTRDPATVRFWAALGTGIAFTGAGLFDAIATRGRHIGWPLLTGVGVAALLSLRS